MGSLPRLFRRPRLYSRPARGHRTQFDTWSLASWWSPGNRCNQQHADVMRLRIWGDGIFTAYGTRRGSIIDHISVGPPPRDAHAPARESTGSVHRLHPERVIAPTEAGLSTSRASHYIKGSLGSASRDCVGGRGRRPPFQSYLIRSIGLHGQNRKEPDGGQH